MNVEASQSASVQPEKVPLRTPLESCSILAAELCDKGAELCDKGATLPKLVNEILNIGGKLQDELQKVYSTGFFRWNPDWDGREKLPMQSDDVYHHIYLIRHGKYLENPKGQDVLSPIGIRQATVTGRRLHTLSRMSTMVKLVHSTLRRAVETTSLIADSLESIPTTPSDLLCEGTFGNEEDIRRMEKAFKEFFYHPTQGPSMINVLVCHANVIKYLVCRALQLPVATGNCLAVANCSITTMVINGKGVVKLTNFGDVGHLFETDLVTY